MGVLMNHEEAKSLSLKVRWKTQECNSGSECWCRLIVPEVPITYEYSGITDEIYIVGSGSLPKDYAEHIVELHNKHVYANIKKD